MRVRLDPPARLVAAIVTHAAAAGVPAAPVSLDSRSWASATFVGERQRIVLAVPPDAARAAWLATLPEAEFAIAGHCLVDLAIVGVAGAEITLETLLIEAG